MAAQGWGERSSRRSSTISDISDINLEVDSSGFEAGAKADDENDDEDDDDVTTAVRGTRRKNWGSHLTLPGPRSPEEGSTTPYHIIEILINSGGDNLPGVSFFQYIFFTLDSICQKCISEPLMKRHFTNKGLHYTKENQQNHPTFPALQKTKLQKTMAGVS